MLLQQLCELDGVSGREDAVRNFLLQNLPSDCSSRVDTIGNLIVFKQGKAKPVKRLVLAAHMDEVGLIATGITDEGYVKFSCVGGIDPRVLPAVRVRFSNGTRGVVGMLPVHLSKGDAKEKIPEVREMHLDIGAKDRQQAEELVSLGDTAAFDCGFSPLGSNLFKGKAVDDRFGCSVLLELLHRELPYDLHAVFTVQEEVGLRGAKAAAFGLQPDYAIIVETTTAADLPGIPEEKKVCRLGRGAALSFMDGRTCYPDRLYQLALDTAREKGIAVQSKEVIAGGNDAGAFQQTGGGAQVVTVSLPCRYIHSPSCVVHREDMDSVSRLVWELYQALAAV